MANHFNGFVDPLAVAAALGGAPGCVAILPEGITHDRPQLAPVKTGAARIALGASAAGVKSLAIVPVGLSFADKVALRSRVLVQVGDTIDVPDNADPDDGDAVRALTVQIDRKLREVAPGFRGRRGVAGVALRRGHRVAKRGSSDAAPVQARNPRKAPRHHAAVHTALAVPIRPVS